MPTGNESGTVVGGGTKLAVTFCDELTVRVQAKLVPELAQAPPQPPNVVGAVGLAVKVIIDPPT